MPLTGGLRSTAKGEVDPRDMAEMLEPLRDAIKWHRTALPEDGGLSGMSGNRAVLLAAGRMAERLPAISTGQAKTPPPAEAMPEAQPEEEVDPATLEEAAAAA